mgnify:CR=1 FL=1
MQILQAPSSILHQITAHSPTLLVPQTSQRAEIMDCEKTDNIAYLLFDLYIFLTNCDIMCQFWVIMFYNDTIHRVFDILKVHYAEFKIKKQKMKTNEYSMFKLSKTNRPITEGHVVETETDGLSVITLCVPLAHVLDE